MQLKKKKKQHGFNSLSHYKIYPFFNLTQLCSKINSHKPKEWHLKFVGAV